MALGAIGVKPMRVQLSPPTRYSFFSSITIEVIGSSYLTRLEIIGRFSGGADRALRNACFIFLISLSSRSFIYKVLLLYHRAPPPPPPDDPPLWPENPLLDDELPLLPLEYDDLVDGL